MRLQSTDAKRRAAYGPSGECKGFYVIRSELRGSGRTFGPHDTPVRPEDFWEQTDFPTEAEARDCAEAWVR